MSEDSVLEATFTLEVHGGKGTPPTIELMRGHQRAAMSFGKRSMWIIDAPGVLDVHGYVYFDGNLLFLQSADDLEPVIADGVVVPKQWTHAAPPCRIEFGAALIIFQATDEDDATTIRNAAALNPPDTPQAPLPSRPFAPGAFATRDDAPTRVEPIEDVHAPYAAPRPAAGESPRASAPPPAASSPSAAFVPFVSPSTAAAMQSSAPLDSGSGGAALALANMSSSVPQQSALVPSDRPRAAVPNAAPKAEEPSRGFWAAASFPKRALVVLSPLVVASIGAIFLYDEAAPPPHAQSPITTPPPRASATAGVDSPKATDAAAPPSHVIVVPAPVTTGAIISLTPLVDVDGGTRSFKTDERAAADAVAAGSFAAAARMYDALATTNPDRQAFREAARILYAKSDGGTF